jgi:hypothetical protein
VTPSLVELRHQSAGRIRIRLADGVRRAALGPISAGLAHYEGVSDVSHNPTTRTILVIHKGDGADILARAERDGLLRCAKPPEPYVRPKGVAPPSQRLASNISGAIKTADAMITSASRGRIDLPLAAFAVVVGASAVRASRGNLFPSAVSLLQLALRLVGMRKK